MFSQKEVYLGIDQSLRSTAACLCDSDGNIIEDTLIRIDPKTDDFIHGEIEIPFKQLDKGWQQILLARRVRDLFCAWYSDLLDRLPSDWTVHVNIEGLGFSARGDATRGLAGLQFLLIDGIEKINDELGAFYPPGINIITPSSLKKFATGSGKADKVEMFEALPEAAKTKYDGVLKSKGRYDLTDAYWLAMWGYRKE